MCHQLIGFFRGRIEAQGVVDVVMDRERHQGIGAVNGARRGKNQMLNFLLPAAFQDIDEPHQIAVDIGIRIDDGIADTGLGRQMNHELEGFFFKKGGDTFPVDEVHPDKAEPAVIFEPGEA